MTDYEISQEIFSLLSKAGESLGFKWNLWHGGTRRRSSKIIELSGSINCLIYFKIRSSEPYRWGVTANRIDELNKSNKRWFTILFYESPEAGYLISQEEVAKYISIWALGSDGDYKVGPGSYLQFHRPFNSFSELLDRLIKQCKV